MSAASSRQPAPGRAGGAGGPGMLQIQKCCKSGDAASLEMLQVWRSCRSGDTGGPGIVVVQAGEPQTPPEICSLPCSPSPGSQSQPPEQDGAAR